MAFYLKKKKINTTVNHDSLNIRGHVYVCVYIYAMHTPTHNSNFLYFLNFKILADLIYLCSQYKVMLV